MKRIKILVLFLLGVALVIISSSWNYNNSQIRLLSNQDNAETKHFIQEIDISKYEKSGSDFGNPKYSPLRIGKTLEEIDITYDYDFDRLAKTTKSLQGVNRHSALNHIFNEITNGAKNNTERHLLVLKFLQRSSLHNLIQPIYPDKTGVFDPLVLLELSEMRCGQVSRVAIDLFASKGIKGRLVQVKNHVLAELFYDDSWHFFDADLLGGDQMIFNSQGEIPSIVELSQYPYAVDAIPYSQESIVSPYRKEYTSYPYASYFYFNYDPSLSLYYEKTATEQEEQNTIYGWNFYKTIKDKDRKIGHIKDFYMPSAVNFKDIQVLRDDSDKKILNLTWFPSEDLDQDILGYKVYVSKHTRGWNYIPENTPENLKNFYNNDHLNWHPEMLALLYKEPPHEIAFIKRQEENISITLEQSGTYYVTVMPYDAHGESVGRVIYEPSPEIKIQV
jgi:hypothetical protein